MAKNSGTKWVIGLVIIAALAVGGLLFAKNQGMVGQKKLTKVSTEKIKTRTIVETVSASGKIYPEIEVKLAPDVSGEVIELLVEEGDSVQSGQLLAKVEPDLYQTAVERAEAAVNSSQANASNTNARIFQIEAQLEQARRNLERNQMLLKEEVVALATVQDAETAVKTLEADLKAAQQTKEGAGYNVKSAKASLKEAKKSLSRTSLYAPMSGIVSRLNVKQGERVVGTSQFEGTELLRIADFDNMELRVDVSENDVVKVRKGMRTNVEIDAYPDRKFEGIVTQISNSTGANTLMSNDQVTNFTVKIRLKKESYADLLEGGNRFAFRPGMSASADIETKRLEDIIAVPIQSVATREIPDSLKTGDPTEDQLKEVIYIIEGGKVEEIDVKTGIQDDTYIHITEGLSDGSEVVSAPYRAISKKLKDEMEVEVVDKEELFQKKDK